MVVGDLIERRVDHAVDNLGRLRALDGDHGGVEGLVVHRRVGVALRLEEAGDDRLAVRGVADDHVSVLLRPRRLGQAIHEQVVQQAAIAVGGQAVLDLPGGELGRVVGRRPIDPGQGVAAGEE